MSINDLTWQDVQNIYIMVNNLTNKLDCDPSLWPEWAFSTEGRFTYILNQFKELKNNDRQTTYQTRD